jgi:hypothetical protein
VSPQAVPFGLLLSWQDPEPLQVSGSSQALLAVPPQEVPAGLKPLSLQAPARQVSWFVHCVPASPQFVPSATLLAWQAPDPLQVSALSQAPLAALPQAVPAGWKPLSTQEPPKQLSWFVHCVPASPQALPFAALFVWQAPAPSQVSGLSHAVSELLPQAVPAALKPLSVQDPEEQVSWFVHSVPASPQLEPSASLLI